nr:MAG TPA: hypothetical protein [Bacteriophage sp.]
MPLNPLKCTLVPHCTYLPNHSTVLIHRLFLSLFSFIFCVM